MKRVHGTKEIPLVECINRYIGKYRVRWDIQPLENDESEEKNGVTFLETDIILKRKPTIYDVKKAVYEGVNKMVDEDIISGFVWNDMPVWLSSENQFNYKAAYDLCVQTDGKNLPVVFKFGSTENPIYHKFETQEELCDFYTNAMRYISDTLSTGWTMKDSVVWSSYEECVKGLTK